jgi:predicted Zn-dependent protease
MQEARLKILKQLVAEEPNEPFNKYALAMEYMNIDQSEALTLLTNIKNEHSDYLPTYYQLGGILTENENSEEAEKIYLEGISLATKQENDKILKELKGAFQRMKDEAEDW